MLTRVRTILALLFVVCIALPVSAATVEFTILHTNDVHGQLEPSGSNPGLARVAAVVNGIREAEGAGNVLLVDAGDSMQGSLLSNIGWGVPTIGTFNAMGYAAAALGNHDFDWGQTVLADRDAQAAYPFLAANIVAGSCSGWTSPTYVKPYEIITVAGVRVAFIGVTTIETPYILRAGLTSGLCFRDPAESILHYYDDMKANSDVIVVLSHLGFTDGGYGYGLPVYGDQTLAARLNNAGKPASIIIGGHSHTNVDSLPGPVVIGSTRVVQAYYSGRRVGRAHFVFDTDTRVATVSWQSLTVATAAPQDPAVLAVILGYANDPAYVAMVNQPVGYAQVDLLRNYNGDSMMGDFVDDAIYQALNNDTEALNDVDMFFNNAGGLRTDWCDAEDPPDSGIYRWSGAVADCNPGVWTHDPMLLTYGMMYSILPFGNAAIVGDMTGAQILDLLNQSATLFKGAIQPAGIRFKFYHYTDAGPGPQPYAWGAFDACVLNKTTGDCEPLDLDRTYRVGSNEFLAPAGQDGFLPFKYMTNITYWGDMLNAVNAWVSANYTLASPYRGPNGDGALDQRIFQDTSGDIMPVTILHHNDSHGNLAKGTYVGYTQLATLIQQERARNPLRTILLSAGDQIQGDSLMYYFRFAPLGIAADETALPPELRTHPMMKVMNSMDYDGMTIGNHEYDFGKDVLTSVLTQATFPLMQANVTDTGEYGLSPLLEPYVEKNLDGIKVAVLGIGNHRVPDYQLPSNIAGLTFTDPITRAQELSDALRASNDAVVALTHIGFTADPHSAEVDSRVDTQMADEVTGLDAIIGGHSHTNPAIGAGDYEYLPALVAGPANTPVLINQAYRYNNTLGEVVLGMREKTGGGYEVVTRAGRYLSVTSSTPEDPAVKDLVDPYASLLTAYNNTEIGETTVPIDSMSGFTQETNAANLQADASVFELESNGIAVDFHLAGAMTNRRIAAGATPASPYTLKISDMFQLIPYENSLVVLSMNGPQIKQVLERAFRNYYYYKYVPGYGGYSYYTTCMLDINAGGQIVYYDPYPGAYDPGQEYVMSLTFDGWEVDFADPDTYYRVSTVNYLAAGSCNFNNGGISLWPITQITNDTQYYVRDAVIDFVENEGTISPAIEGRLVFTDDNDPPVINVLNPQPGFALQDGQVLRATVTDQSGIEEVLFYIRADDGGDGTPIEGFEGVPAVLSGGVYRLDFDTLQLPDGNYLFFATATDEFGNEGKSSVIPFSIRNWAVLEMLPQTPRSKANRTMPVKFTLRVAPGVDPDEPFVYNTELAVKIYQCLNTSCSTVSLKQTSYYGMGARDYRIDNAAEMYITNFKTASKPARYKVEIWRATQNFVIGSFYFETVK